jgi:hypothetical protein
MPWSFKNDGQLFEKHISLYKFTPSFFKLEAIVKQRQDVRESGWPDSSKLAPDRVRQN